jgi:hypothetical protein
MRLQVAVLALLLRSRSLAAAAVAAGGAAGGGGGGIKCASGWGQEERVISSKWINDGYCDCPLDGQDEPGTDACSGSAVGGWAGVKSISDARYVYYSISFSRLGLLYILELRWKHGSPISQYYIIQFRCRCFPTIIYL